MTGLWCSGNRVSFELVGCLKFEGGDEVVGGRERNNYLIGGERGDKWLGENLVGGNTCI